MAIGTVNRTSIKNIIFDFGGVICNIDFKIAEKNFVQLGFKLNQPDYPAVVSNQIFIDFEAGLITPRQFRDNLKGLSDSAISDSEFDNAWNSLLLDIPEPRIRLLEQIRGDYRIFLLSNTNEIHYTEYLERFRNQYGYSDFNALFEKAYLSYQMGLKKPDLEIFSHVLEHSALNPGETLFIDDTLVHVKAAHSLGIHAHHLDMPRGQQIMDLFRPE